MPPFSQPEETPSLPPPHGWLQQCRLVQVHRGKQSPSQVRVVCYVRNQTLRPRLFSAGLDCSKVDHIKYQYTNKKIVIACLTNHWGEELKGSNCRQTPPSSPDSDGSPLTTLPFTSVLHHKVVLCSRTSSPSTSLSPTSSTWWWWKGTSLYPRRFPSALQSRPSSPPSSSFATLCSVIIALWSRS